MNKRVRKLAKQAGFGLYSDGEIYTAKLEHLPITENMEKFAELIVKECISEVVNRHGEYFATQSLKWQMGCRIKEHFGVE